MEISDFEFFINREKDKPCLVAGNAPTIINFPFDKFRGIYILGGSGPQLLKKIVSPNYWVTANTVFPVPQKHIKIINAVKDCVFIFSDTAIYSNPENVYDYDFLKDNIKGSWFAFDHCHFKHKKCEPPKNCCKLVDLYPNRITFQEFAERQFGVKNMWHGSGTAVIFSLIFAILMGCSPIYLQGVELPLYLKDYHYYNKLHNLYPLNIRQTFKVVISQIEQLIFGKSRHSAFYYSIDQTLASLENLVNLCHKIGIEIYNLSPTSTINQVKSLPYLDYRKVCR